MRSGTAENGAQASGEKKNRVRGIKNRRRISPPVFYTGFLRERKLPYGNTACQNTSIAEIGLGGPASKPAETAVFSAKREGAAYRSWG